MRHPAPDPAHAWRPFAGRLVEVLRELARMSPVVDPASLADGRDVVDLGARAPALEALGVPPAAVRVTRAAWQAMLPGDRARLDACLRSAFWGVLPALRANRRRFCFGAGVDLAFVSCRVDADGLARVVIGLADELGVGATLATSRGTLGVAVAQAAREASDEREPFEDPAPAALFDAPADLVADLDPEEAAIVAALAAPDDGPPDDPPPRRRDDDFYSPILRG